MQIMKKTDPKPSSSSSSSSLLLLLSKRLSDASTQNLSSILNNLHVSDNSWSSWWSSLTFVQIPEFSTLVLSSKPSGLLEVSRSDFISYLSSLSDHYNRFEDIRNLSNNQNNQNNNNINNNVNDDKNNNVNEISYKERAGEALVECLKEVPALYFKEDFALEDGAIFRAAASMRLAGTSSWFPKYREEDEC